LARLETLTANLVHSIAESRHEGEQELNTRRRELETALGAKTTDLEREYKSQDAKLKEREDALAAKQKELDDREAKHARRQLYIDQKAYFLKLGRQFGMTFGTRLKRIPVHIFTILLLGAAGANLGRGLFDASRVTSDEKSPALVFLGLRILVSALALGATAIYYSKWMSHWFQRHANEEFRLKRMELDLDRASWFVELAFQWRDENGEPLPDELIEALTRQLFMGGTDEKPPLHPADIFSAGYTKLQVSPQGTTIEMDRRRNQKKQAGASTGENA
jgi:hypothetical protein